MRVKNTLIVFSTWLRWPFDRRAQPVCSPSSSLISPLPRDAFCHTFFAFFVRLIPPVRSRAWKSIFFPLPVYPAAHNPNNFFSRNRQLKMERKIIKNQGIKIEFYLVKKNSLIKRQNDSFDIARQISRPEQKCGIFPSGHWEGASIKSNITCRMIFIPHWWRQCVTIFPEKHFYTFPGTQFIDKYLEKQICVIFFFLISGKMKMNQVIVTNTCW